MPELPEVEATRTYLDKEQLTGQKIKGLLLHWPHVVRNFASENLLPRIEGSEISRIQRRGKFILIKLISQCSNQEATLAIHLGMTGALFLQNRSDADPKFVSATFLLSDGRKLLFVDPRKFGGIQFAQEESIITGHLGVEPLHPSFNPKVMQEFFRCRATPIKPILLEQKYIAGIGNIYADEALFRARIHPMQCASSLTNQQIVSLHQGIVESLELAIAFLTKIMPIQRFPTNLDQRKHLLINRHEGKQCPKGCGVIERLVIHGRSAYFCPKWQLLRKTGKP